MDCRLRPSRKENSLWISRKKEEEESKTIVRSPMFIKLSEARTTARNKLSLKIVILDE